MAVGPNFQSEDTQAAIQAQAAQDTQTPTPEQNPADANVDTAAAESQAQDTQTSATETDKSDLNMDAQAKETPAAEKQDTTDDTTPTKLEKVTDDNLKEQGFDVDSLLKQVRENKGVVPDEVKDQLREKYTDTAVDTIVGEVETTFKDRAGMNTYIYETLAGGDATKGQENFKTLSEWCQKNMDAAEVAAINQLLMSNNKDVVRKGLEQAVGAWRKGQEKPMMSGDSESVNRDTTPAALEPLSRDEFIEIMATEKYNTDPEYAAQIDKRRQATIDKGDNLVTPEFSKYRPPRG